MAEVQSHGFTWEADLLQNVYGLTKEEKAQISYTEKFDLPSRFNKLGPVNISVKCIGEKNAICMGDALRVFDEVSALETPLHLTLVSYEQVGNTKNVKAIKELNLTASNALLFGSLTRSQIQELDTLIKAAARETGCTDVHKQAELNRLSGYIQFNPKVNTQQSRLQCSFSFKQFQAFLTQHPERIVAESTTNQFKGGSIQASIQAGPRVFH